MSVTITDNGRTRMVEIVGEQRGFGGVVHHSRFETHYSRATIEALLAVKGEMWLRDEIARSEEPAYVQEPLRRQLERFVAIEGRRVLDFGCGCGGSSLALARLGAGMVVGVEPRADFLAAARLRAQDSGLAARIIFQHVPDTTRLPFANDEFDLIVMNAVLEHIPPPQRRAHLREVWRVLRVGGYLFIGETPNRLWPQDYHTTGLWWVPYMPADLACRYARARRRVPATATTPWLLSEGAHGSTYWEVMAALGPQARCLNRQYGSDVDAFWARSLARSAGSPRRTALKKVLYALHRLIDQALWRPLGIPAVAFLPELTLCLEKTQA